ncbi:hypothetical protein CHS0354_031879 [Potamilus streckersoni]|uniref:Uncharacterized protein n=1 Tax=Potamilus streckersoni TaxID=2493646 RepID=A0AAE0RXS5_9BIVA|nr:hypothetical protein CHS0354_031879 [Potamilus streckersoni]
MASQGILFRYFLVHGLLMEVSKGQNIINGDKDGDASLIKTLTQTTKPLQEILKPARNCAGQEIRNDTLKSSKENINTLIKQGVPNVQGPEHEARLQNIVVIRSHALAMKGKNSKSQVQLYSLIREKNEKDLTKATKSRKQGEHIGYFVTDGEIVDKNYIPVDETQNQTQEQHLLIFEKINITDDYEEYEPTINNQLQIQTIEDEEGVFDGINTTDIPEELEPVVNIKLQNQTRTEPKIGIFDRINTTEVPEKFQPVTNYTGAVINKPVQGRELYNNILTQGHTTITRDKVSDHSLLQALIWTTTEPRLEVFDGVNATDVPKELEPETNSTGVIINQPASGQEIQNDTLKSGRSHP